MMQVMVSRGALVESIHQVSYVVLDQDCKIVESTQNLIEQDFQVYPRSAIKLIQAMPLLMSGAFQSFELTAEHLALACASHSGETIHTDLARAWADKISVKESDLVCAPHLPIDPKTALELNVGSQSANRFHNNCSGKHLGFLTVCRHKKWSLDYQNPGHPLQVELKKNFNQLLALANPSQSTQDDFKFGIFGIDGCGVPTYAMGLKQLAQLYVPFLKDLSSSPARSAADQKTYSILKSIFQACYLNSEFVSGTEAFFHQLKLQSRIKFVVKSGAEGVFIALSPEQNRALAIKVHDGGERAAKAAVVFLLRNFEILAGPVTSFEQELHDIKNWAGEKVGEIKVSLPSSLN